MRYSRPKSADGPHRYVVSATVVFSDESSVDECCTVVALTPGEAVPKFLSAVARKHGKCVDTFINMQVAGV